MWHPGAVTGSHSKVMSHESAQCGDTKQRAQRRHDFQSSTLYFQRVHPGGDGSNAEVHSFSPH